ncbi:chalcone isomerase family protein [Marinicella sediminis]|uniref:Chalcone isomerase family protein n=1 Tax=Marinicella sediminis TaxID=1792834 RepID=A0ABV7JBU8_9GAMM|nr:chalcone isomerase family protein [Marinicella sediminis]
MISKKFTALASLLLCQTAWATDNLPSTISHNTADFQLCEDFTLRYGVVIKVAEIGWYAPDCSASVSLLEANQKILRFHYHKNVSGDFFRESAEEYFLINLENKEQQRDLTQPLQQFNQGYTDIKSGEYFDLVHWQDKELNLFKNNQLLASTTNPILANKYFNIWFGKSPVINKLKKAFIESP